MNDDALDARLHAYADGALAPGEAAAVEAELAAHPELRERLDELRLFQRHLRAGLGALPALSYPRASMRFAVDRAALQAAQRQRARRINVIRYAAAACLVIGASGLVILPLVKGEMRVIENISGQESEFSVSPVTIALPTGQVAKLERANGDSEGPRNAPVFERRYANEEDLRTGAKDRDQAAYRFAQPAPMAASTGHVRLDGVTSATSGRPTDAPALVSEPPENAKEAKGMPGPPLEIPNLVKADEDHDQENTLREEAAQMTQEPYADELGVGGVAYAAGGRNDASARLRKPASSPPPAPLLRDYPEQMRQKQLDSAKGERATGNKLQQGAQVAGKVDIDENDRIAELASGAATTAQPAEFEGMATKAGEDGRAAAPQRRLADKKKALQVTDELQASGPIPAPGPVNPFVLADRDRLSTFSIATGNASFALCRRYLDGGYLPPPGLVRMEEFVNAFDHHYPARADATFAVHVTGGPSPFGHGLALIQVGVKARVAGRDGRRPAHLVLAIDASGSMDRPDRLPLVRDGVHRLLRDLDPADRVTVVTFANDARLTAQSLPASDSAAIDAALAGIAPMGASNLAAGLDLALSQAEHGFLAGAVNRVVLLSDGVANLGATEATQLIGRVEAARRQGIATTTVGVGAGAYDDALLSRLAARGDGAYLRLDPGEEALEAFAGEFGAAMRTVAKDAKIQVEFDPARVRRWRLVGHEDRVLAARDFRDDAVDAGEVGSGQSATALYEVELLEADAGAPTRSIGTVRVRWHDPADGAVHELERAIPADAIHSRSVADAPRFALAAAAAEFAELLRGSEHAADGSLDAVIGLVARVAQVLPNDQQVAELLRLVQRAKGLPRAP